MTGARARRLAAVVVAVVLAFTSGALLWTHRQASERESARAEAIAAAPGRVEALLSYDSPTVDADLARAAGGATGEFGDGFREFASKTVAPQSKERQISTRARVAEVGFLSGTANHAQLLMFVDQITTSAAQPAPATASSRVRVGLDLVDGQWLVSEMTPI